jgi:hypothetical protein
MGAGRAMIYLPDCGAGQEDTGYGTRYLSRTMGPKTQDYADSVRREEEQPRRGSINLGVAWESVGRPRRLHA